MYAQVAFSRVSSFIDKNYTYLIPEELREKIKVGHQVLIPFGKRMAVGYIVGLSGAAPEGVKNIKQIKELRGEFPLFSEETVEAAKWMSDYYVSFFGTALHVMLPPGSSGLEKIKGKKKIDVGPGGRETAKIQEKYSQKNNLSEDQKKHIDLITDKIQNPAGKPMASYGADKSSSTILLFGPSGSGKTRIYIESVKYAMSLGKGSVVLLPEISPMNLLVKEFKDEFDQNVSVLHSTMPEKDRLLEWAKIYRGQSRVVIGTRSALFAPVRDLGLIIIDQEEGFTYKQEQNPKYHAREAAVFISRQKNIPLILGSASPSIETFYKAKNGIYVLCRLNSKEDKNLSQVSVVDMRKEELMGAGIFSKELYENISSALKNKEKTILFINRRGHSPFIMCRECGQVVECRNCSLSLSYHTQDKLLHCNHCGLTRPAPIVCPKCTSSLIQFMGSGTQKIESEISKYFPGIKVIRIDRDAIKAKNSQEIALKMFAEGDADILIGTQMAVKALEYTKVALVGLISADTALNSPDFRAAEETVHMLSDVCGISSRHYFPEKIIIQTYNSDHYAVSYARELDYESFYEKEIAYRKESMYPPFSGVINIIIYGKNQKIAEESAEEIASKIKSADNDASVLGPAQTRLAKVRGQTRWQILIKGNNLDIIKKELRRIIYSFKRKDTRLSIDVDPINV